MRVCDIDSFEVSSACGYIVCMCFLCQSQFELSLSTARYQEILSAVVRLKAKRAAAQNTTKKSKKK